MVGSEQEVVSWAWWRGLAFVYAERKAMNGSTEKETCKLGLLEKVLKMSLYSL